MTNVVQSVEVDVPLSAAYNQCTQFEYFPCFLHGIEEVRQLDDKRLRWRADIDGLEQEWEAEIFEQIPDVRISWRTTTGARNLGIVTFTSMGPKKTRVTLELNYNLEKSVDNVSDGLGALSARICGDIQRFKDFIEARRFPGKAWRGHANGRKADLPQSS
jgi:uncharacterized membrane protein